MTRKNFKFLLSIFIVITMAFSFANLSVIATEIAATSEAVTTSETDTTTSEETTTEESEIHSGDLYLLDTKVVMDKLVDGNVFILGQEVEITGQVNGSLFVCADKLTFNQSYIKNNIFACANSVYYNGACNDFYVVSSNDLEMTYDSYVVRDVKALSTNTILKAAIGRDVDLISNTISFGEGEDIPVIYGNLRYTAPEELTLPEGVITDNGTVTYTSQTDSNNNDSTNSVTDIIINCAIYIVTALAIFIILKKAAPNFVENLNNQKFSVINLLKAFGIGIGSIILVVLFCILLLGTTIGIKLAFILALIFITLCLMSVPVFAITITNKLKEKLKLEKSLIIYLLLGLVSVILYLITLIPYAGWIFSLLITPISIGLLVKMIIPHKELTEEEKIAIAEAKKQTEENGESDNNNKKKKTILIVVGTIILILLVVIVLSLPRLTSAYQIFKSSSDATNSATDISQQIIEQTQEATDNIQQQLQNMIN